MEAVKILDQELRNAGIPIIGVSGNEPPFIVEYSSEATPEQITQGNAIVAAFDPVAEVAEVEAEEYQGRLDIEDLATDIENELAWIDGTGIPNIDNGLAAVGAFTNTIQRAIITGILNNQKRIFLEQKKELKVWKHTLRWFD